MAERKRNCRVAPMAEDADDTRETPEPPGSDETPASDGTAAVTRSVDLDATVDDVWRAVTDPAERALWLDDPDARDRRVREDDRVARERLVWTWWHPGDEGSASRVSVVLRPLDGGGTQVVVTESRPAAGPVVVVASASPRPWAAAPSGTTWSPGAVRIGGAHPAGRQATLSPSWIRCALDRWDSRLLGLELRFVAARAAVA